MSGKNGAEYTFSKNPLWPLGAPSVPVLHDYKRIELPHGKGALCTETNGVGFNF
jgi:hypothetical protein